MKKIILTLLLFYPFYLIAQNVGIGTTTPVSKLNLVGSGSSPAIPGASSAGVFRIGIGASDGIDFGKMGSPPFSGWMQSGFDGNIADPLSLQPLGGNLGIGTTSPAEKLDVNGNSTYNGTMKLQGLNLFEFGAGVAGKELNAGKIGYNAFGHNALTFVGAGTNTTNRAVYFFAEGGTTMNGPLDIAGTLKINGNAGTAGQVLTSNGASDPQWKNTAFGNAIRFSVNINHTLSTGHSLAGLGSAYNLSPADVTISATTFTINKSGLYHFDLYLNTVVSAFSGTTMYFNYYFNPSASLYPDLLSDETILVGSTGIARMNYHFSVDMHITAPATIGLGGYHVLGAGGTVTGKLYGHLISE